VLHGHVPRVLIIDDNAEAVEAMVALIRVLGYDSRGAPDGHAALALAAQWRPDIIFLDIGMPGMDGYEVVRRIRSVPEIAGTAVIAWTGFGEDEDRRRAEHIGFDRYLVKPVDVRTLRAVLAEFSPKVPPPTA
jgi:CheY-like chemotaxis protein